MLVSCFQNGVDGEVVSRVGGVLESWFFFSLVWSVGATCDNDGRKAFSLFLRERMKELKVSLFKFKQSKCLDHLLRLR